MNPCRVLPLASSLAMLLVTVACALPASAREPALPIVGRWDVTVRGPGYQFPSWFEIREDDSRLTMRMVGAYGAVTDVPFVTWDGEQVEFQLANGHRWRGRYNGRWLAGTTAGNAESWEAVRAPKLRAWPARFGAWRPLFDGRSLAGWRARHPGSRHGWTVRDGALSNQWPEDDLRTAESFTNFKLSLEYRLQPGADSGVHLRGRYEVQLTDREDPAAHAGGTGSIYGFLAPTPAVGSRAGEWNRLEVTLLGREVTVAINGTVLIERAEIPGITGDALDSSEAEAGPIVLQGYLGQVEYRNLRIATAP